MNEALTEVTFKLWVKSRGLTVENIADLLLEALTAAADDGVVDNFSVRPRW